MTLVISMFSFFDLFYFPL